MLPTIGLSSAVALPAAGDVNLVSAHLHARDTHSLWCHPRSERLLKFTPAAYRPVRHPNAPAPDARGKVQRRGPDGAIPRVPGFEIAIQRTSASRERSHTGCIRPSAARHRCQTCERRQQQDGGRHGRAKPAAQHRHDPSTARSPADVCTERRLTKQLARRRRADDVECGALVRRLHHRIPHHRQREVIRIRQDGRRTSSRRLPSPSVP